MQEGFTIGCWKNQTIGLVKNRNNLFKIIYYLKLNYLIDLLEIHPFDNFYLDLLGFFALEAHNQ